MLYSRLGQSGLIVSRLSLGTMTFTRGGGNAAIAKTDQASADRIVGRALDAGVNFIDTADVYADGQSEEIVGALIRGRRDQVVLATKAGWRKGEALNRSGLGAVHLLRSIDESLTRLGTDHVDLYLAHRNDANTPLEETLHALDAIVRAGKARYLGFSNWPAWKVAAAVQYQRDHGLAPFTHGQMMYHLLGRGIEDEVAPMLRHFGLGLTAWSPLAGGFLSGKYTRDKLKADGADRLSGFDQIPFDKESGFALVDRLRAMADAHGATVAQVAIAWLLAKPLVSSVVLGASRLVQLDDTLAAADLALGHDEVAELDRLTAPPPSYPGWVVDVPDAAITAALTARPGQP
ncbi:aldo/keto reductase [Sphingomonas bacterium]|uniref:aldo/keto reductase n=1 Tax=Sphingomonas bacterium TaxID=1895847 RepID=UPI0015769F93|nr:aldo/keto reductase [Sphingomonas bacterium]